MTDVTDPDADVVAVLERAFPDRRVVAVEDLSGMAHRTVGATLDGPPGDVVVALLRHDHLAERFAVAPALTRLVAAETDLPVPTVLAADADPGGSLPPYAVSERIPGESPPNRFHDATPLDADAVREAGRLLGRLHAQTPADAAGRFRPDGDGGLQFQPDDWTAILRSIAESQLDQLAGLDDFAFADAVPRIRAALDDALAAVAGGDDPVFCHHDYRPANLVFRDGGVAGVVDWERALRGDPAYDLTKAVINFADAPARDATATDRLRTALREGYAEARPPPTDDDRRRRAYRLLHHLEVVWAYPVWRSAHDPADRPAVESALRARLDESLAPFA